MAKKPPISLGQNIRAARKAKGYGQLALAHAVGYHGKSANAFISRVEANKQTPRLAMLYRIAEALNVDLQILTRRK